MTDRTVETSPQLYARIGGVLYLMIIVLGIVGEAFVRGRIVVPGDATATAANLRSMESLWRFGIAAELFLLICSVVLALIVYVLLRPVRRDFALLAAFFNVISIAMEGAYSLQLVEALFPLGNAGYLKAFAPEQLHAMASLSARSHVYGFGVSLIFFGCFCLVIGYLIFRSGYFPKVVGVLMQIAGLSYLINSFALILAPPLRRSDIPRHCSSWLCWRGITLPLASCEGRERSEVERESKRLASQRSIKERGRMSFSPVLSFHICAGTLGLRSSAEAVGGAALSTH